MLINMIIMIRLVIEPRKVFMKTISAVDARKGLGRLLNLVSLNHETIIIERAGEKLAVLKPYEVNSGVAPPLPPEGKLNLLDVAGMGSEIWHGVDVNAYVQKEREPWG